MPLSVFPAPKLIMMGSGAAISLPFCSGQDPLPHLLVAAASPSGRRSWASRLGSQLRAASPLGASRLPPQVPDFLWHPRSNWGCFCPARGPSSRPGSGSGHFPLNRKPGSSSSGSSFQVTNLGKSTGESGRGEAKGVSTPMLGEPLKHSLSPSWGCSSVHPKHCKNKLTKPHLSQF